MLIAVALLLVPATLAAQAKQPRTLVEEAVDRALTVLRDPSLQAPDKRHERFERVRAAVASLFDWREMARRSLGVHWRSIDDAQRARFVELFEQLLADRYMEELNRFRGNERVLVHDAHQEGEVYRVETTVVTHSRERVPIHYFLHKSGDSYRIHDFSIEGVSLVNHYRKSFSRFLVNRSFDELLRKLESKAGKGR
ncbi:MAG: ABC transporter substrate-binding protein [Myxococcales bacterium]|nr:ABC transporter substrate-binding protein [Myxococcales bacterium]